METPKVTEILKAFYTYNKGQFLQKSYLALWEGNKIIGFAKPFFKYRLGDKYCYVYNVKDLPSGVYLLKSLGRYSLWEIKNQKAYLIQEKFKIKRGKNESNT